MHIPDGYLGPQTYLAMYGAITPVWLIAGRKLKQTLKKAEIPRLALGAAFAFTIMLFSLPVPGGTTAHPIGGALIAILLGPWAAVISISTALAIQAFVFGDGGVTALGANCFTAAFLGPMAGYWVWRVLSGPTPSPRRERLGAGAAAFIAVNITAQATALLVGLQPIIARGADGRPLYFPYGLSVTMPAMALPHIVIGLVEAVVTVGVLAYLRHPSSDKVLLEELTERS